MDALQGAALGVKLPHLDGWNDARRRVAAAYQSGLPATLTRPAHIGADHACHVYAIRVPERDAMRERLHRAGVATNVHYPVPVHLQPAYAGLGYGAGDFPNSEALARETLSLPLYPELPPHDVSTVIEAVGRVTSGVLTAP
jgi:dTDP-4-amino-4,6-dideoxygalactose transaminase